jgi:8-oxo-dGTP pyrophosphatase MutT (NUDIX family)
MSKSKFQPKTGQVDYHDIRYAPVINCVVKHQEKILLVERSSDMNYYPGYWNGISGFLDDKQDLEQKVRQELKEEIGLDEQDIKSIKYGEIFHQDEPKYNKTWIVHPVLVEVKTDKIKLDWEAQNYKWLSFFEAKEYKLLPGFDKVLQITSKI